MENNLTFARKYRPKTMDEYMGDAIKKTVKARFSDPKHYPHVILFHGSRGTGKTSMARLLSKEYLCQNKTPEGYACGECWACKEVEESLIEGGNQIEGVQEIDIATDGGKGAIEDMLQDAMIPPMMPLKYKIIILDECHMATNQAQNALLKIVEEPPEHLVFMFCTTNPEKMITPLKSRCQVSLEVKRPTVDELANYMLKICQAEGITTSIEALRIIAKKCGRIPRESLSKLEGIAIEYGRRVTVDNVSNAMGEVATEHFINFYQLANSKNNRIEALLRFINGLKENDIAYRDFLSGLIRFTLDCMYIKYGIGTDDFPLGFVKQAKQLFQIYDTNELDTILQIIEYAFKLANTDDEAKNELIIMNTGLRIGKTKMLNMCLQNSKNEAEFENSQSVKEHAKKENSFDNTVKTIRSLDDTTMSAVFGAEITEVSSQADISFDIDDDEDTEEDTQHELLDFLKNCADTE